MNLTRYLGWQGVTKALGWAANGVKGFFSGGTVKGVAFGTGAAAVGGLAANAATDGGVMRGLGSGAQKGAIELEALQGLVGNLEAEIGSLNSLTAIYAFIHNLLPADWGISQWLGGKITDNRNYISNLTDQLKEAQVGPYTDGEQGLGYTEMAVGGLGLYGAGHMASRFIGGKGPDGGNNDNGGTPRNTNGGNGPGANARSAVGGNATDASARNAVEGSSSTRTTAAAVADVADDVTKHGGLSSFFAKHARRLGIVGAIATPFVAAGAAKAAGMSDEEAVEMGVSMVPFSESAQLAAEGDYENAAQSAVTEGAGWAGFAAGATAGGVLGAQAGALGGPFAWATVPAGGVIGGLVGGIAGSGLASAATHYAWEGAEFVWSKAADAVSFWGNDEPEIRPEFNVVADNDNGPAPAQRYTADHTMQLAM